MTVSVGAMQGRLLPPFEGRFQAFPADGWRDEFFLARDAGLACIEWIYERPHEAENPIGSDAGIDEIRRLTAETGVAVRSICADYYMTDQLVRPDGVPEGEVLRHLEWLIGRAGSLGATYVVLPFVDASSLRTPAEVNGAAVAITNVLPAAEKVGVELHVECDLPPDRFVELLTRVGHRQFKANYDIGNSASLGFDPAEELTALAPFLGSVHVKDRALSGSTVPLGTGNADFDTCFGLMRRGGFDRWFVLQVARGTDGEEVEWARRNRAFVEGQWHRAAAWQG